MSDNPAENRTLITSWDTQEVTEDQAFTILHQLSLRFGWVGTMFTREDADAAMGTEDELTDEMWHDLQMTWEWRKGLQEIITERGFEIISDAVSDVLPSGDYADG